MGLEVNLSLSPISTLPLGISTGVLPRRRRRRNYIIQEEGTLKHSCGWARPPYGCNRDDDHPPSSSKIAVVDGISLAKKDQKELEHARGVRSGGIRLQLNHRVSCPFRSEVSDRHLQEGIGRGYCKGEGGGRIC